MNQLFSRHRFDHSFKLSKLGLFALVIAVAGCNSNSTEAKSSEITNSNTALNVQSTSNENPKSDPEVVAALEANFKASGFDQKIYAAIPTKMDNIYWVTGEGIPAFFTDKEGRHIIQGQIVEIGQSRPVDISAELVANTAREKLAAVDKDELIIFPAKGETKAVVYTFTDADCSYCAKLHSEMDDINNLGIEVRYLAWPRSEGSIPKMEAIWCSKDRLEAMNKAKSGKDVSASTCDNPVRDHMKLGLNLGVTGTPAIYTESGYQIGGYLPAKQLAEAAIASK